MHPLGTVAQNTPCGYAGRVFSADRERSRARIRGVVESMAEIAANPLPTLGTQTAVGPMSKEAIRKHFTSS